MAFVGNADGETAHARIYLRVFVQRDLDTIARLTSVVRAHKEDFIRRWHELYVSRVGLPSMISDRSFHDLYVPYLRSAVMRLGTGDAEGFVAFAAVVGEHLAQSGIPFAVLLAQINLLKESCLEILAELPGGLSHEMLLTIDKLTACSINAAADSYYRCWRAPAALPARAGMAIDLPPEVPGPLPADFHGMVGRSAGMLGVYDDIRRVAAARSPVLIVGETGTGKELIARAIHAEGPRVAAPFVAVNCAALPRELIESELFGYRRGAFSGAMSDHLGLFRSALGGTVLLDEITEMSPEMQAKLLRVVQESSVRPVGAVDEVKIDVRFISSTNREPEALLAGALRSDLYYRLSVNTITVPPVRHRDEDILLLIEHCLGVLNQQYGDRLTGVRGVGSEALAELMQSPWPGNVRELFNVLERAFGACSGLHIGIEDLGPRRRVGASAAASGREGETYAESERALIERCLQTTGGNKAQAARQLGISRKKLYARLAKYALSGLVLAELATLAC